MSAGVLPESPTLVSAEAGERIIVIGSGPVGMRFVQRLLARQPAAAVQLFGNEPYQPYNRVQLSAVLAGDVDRGAIDIPLPSAQRNPNFSFVISVIRNIDTEQKTVADVEGNVHPFDRLVIATGGRAHIPSIPGVDQTGVYTFRNMKDAESLYARVARSRYIVVVGGGLLGIEAAKGLLQRNTRVTLVQQGPRLMNRQLTDGAAALLQQRIESMGVRVVVNSGVRQILGDGRVSGVKTLAGEVIECDTVLLCAGIQPNTELAQHAGLKVATGIVVDDHLRTSHPDIFAIGECCEHRGQTYGIVAPGFEQAAVAADVVHGGDAQYVGSQVASRLKVVGENVFSTGEVVDLPQRPQQYERTYSSRKAAIHRSVVVHKGRIIGAAGFGGWPESNRIQEAVQSQRRVWRWQQWWFKATGRLWPLSDADAVSQWPENAIVCQCNNIAKGALVHAIAGGCSTPQALSDITGAGTVCGSCKPLLAELTGVDGPREKERGWLPVLVTSFVAALIALLVVALPESQTADTVQAKPWFEGVWNDHFWKQVSGFSLLGLSVIGLLMSLRKRFSFTWMGQFSHWRVVHAALGMACAVVLIFHTGFHLGTNLNQWLMLNFLTVLVVGAATGLVVAMSHRLKPVSVKRVRNTSNWLHILAVWPLPALLGSHILSVYYF